MIDDSLKRSDNSSLDSSQMSQSHRKLSSMFYRLFATVEFCSEGRELRKVLNLYHLIFLGISCTIGAGSYSIIGLAAQQAGPGIIVTFIVVGLLCYFTCFPYAEFAAKIQSAGFSYSYAYATCGEFVGYLVGHCLHLLNIAGSAICARCFSAYLAGFLGMCGIKIPVWFYDLEVYNVHICLLGALLIIAFSVLMLFGMEESTSVNNVVAIINILTLVFAIIAGFFYIQPEKYYSNFFPFGMRGVFSGMGLTFYTYLGFESVTCFTEEAKNPERDMPLTLLLVVLIAIIINGCIALVMTGMAPLYVMNTNESLLAAFKQCPFWMSVIISFGSLSGLTASASAGLMCQPRILYSMAFDGLLPKKFMKTNPNTNAPEFAIIITCIVCVVITLGFDVEIIGNTVSLAGLIVSSIVDLSVIVARYDNDGFFGRKISRSCFIFFFLSLLLGFSFYYKWSSEVACTFITGILGIFIFVQYQPQLNIPVGFACPCVPLVPFIGALSFLLLSTTVDLSAWIIFMVYIILGAISYIFYGYKQSKLNPYRKNSMASIRQASLSVDLLKTIIEPEEPEINPANNEKTGNK